MKIKWGSKWLTKGRGKCIYTNISYGRITQWTSASRVLVMQEVKMDAINYIFLCCPYIISIKISLFYNDLKIMHTSGYVDFFPSHAIISLVFLALSMIEFFFL